MTVDRYTGKYNYYNDYEVQDFYIRFPHYEKNALFVDGVPVGVIEAKPDDAAEDVTLKRNLILSLVYLVRCLEHGTFAVDLILDGSGKKKIDITPDEVMSNGGDWWRWRELNPRVD